MKPTTLLCTVGTSLFTPNLRGLDPEVLYARDPHPSDAAGLDAKAALDRYGLWKDRGPLRGILSGLRQSFDHKNWRTLGGQLSALPPELRLCGAEINSTAAMVRKGFLSDNRERLVLLVSHTEEGQAIGTILTKYFTERGGEIRFNRCEPLPVEGLQDERPLVFQKEGLTNLVRLLGEQLRKWGAQNIAINATGGYKAQIALAVAFGQAARCPVFYKHERFDQIIRFPRVPFTMDLSMVEEHLKLWADLAEPRAVFGEREIDRYLPEDGPLREAILPLLDCIEEDGETYYSMSALGMVYWEAYRTANPDLKLEPEKVGQRLGCRFPQHHYPEGFRDYVERVYNALPAHIIECHAVDYSGQKGIRNRFYIEGGRITGEYVDREKFGGRFAVQTSAINELERNWVLHQLNNWLSSGALR